VLRAAPVWRGWSRQSVIDRLAGAAPSAASPSRSAGLALRLQNPRLFGPYLWHSDNRNCGSAATYYWDQERAFKYQSRVDVP